MKPSFCRYCRERSDGDAQRELRANHQMFAKLQLQVQRYLNFNFCLKKNFIAASEASSDIFQIVSLWTTSNTSKNPRGGGTPI